MMLALEDVLAVELLEHLRLGGVDDVAEVHVVLERALEGDLDRLGIGMVASPVARARATVPESAPKATPLDMRVWESPPMMTAQSSTVRSLRTLWMTSVIADSTRRSDRGGDEAEVVHEAHQLRDVGLGLGVPDRGRVAARLVGAVDGGRDHGRGHHLQLLGGHQARWCPGSRRC